MKIFEAYDIPLDGKNAVVIGRSNIVGKPVAMLLLRENGTVTICHSKTKNLAEITKNADILVAAIGKPCFVTEDMVKPGAIVIDVGINRMEDGKLKGDVDFETVNQKASYITPVPGGVGPMTVAMLMNNVIKATKRQNGMIGILFPCFCPYGLKQGKLFLLPADYLIQQSGGGTLGLPCGVGVNVHRGTDVGVSQQLLHVLGSRPVGQEVAG